MNILMVNTFDKVGGSAILAYKLKRNLEKRGHNVSFFVKNKIGKDINTFNFPESKFRKIIAKNLSTDINFFESDWILKTKEFEKADIVHLHNIHGYYFNLSTFKKILKKKPVLWTLHDLWALTPFCAFPYESKFKNGFFKCNSLKYYPGLKWNNQYYLIKAKSDFYRVNKFNIATPSRWLYKIVKKSILKEQNIFYIPNGVDENVYKKLNKTQARKIIGLPTNKKIILFLANGGRTNYQKGWSYFERVIEYYKKKNNILFIEIGGNKNSHKYPNLINTGYIESTFNLNKYYAAADIFVLPSLYENLPLSVVEAMSSGTPVVSFKVGGVAEVIRHKKNGYIAEYKSSNDLIRGVKTILGLSKYKYFKYSNNSRETVLLSFTEKKMTDKYLNVYQKILN